MRVPHVAFLLLFGAPLLALPARAQVESREGIALQNQIDEVRHELEQLREQIGQSQGNGGSSLGGYQAPPAPAEGSPPPDITAQLLARVQQLEEEVRALRGRVDEVDNARQRDSEDLNKQIGDINFKLGNGAGAAPASATPGLGAPPGTMSPPPRTLGAPGAQTTAGLVPPAPPPAKRTPEMTLQEGNTALVRKDYPTAEAAARAVLTTGGPRATDAQLLLGRALYGKRDFSGAAVAFDDAYNRSHAGLHAQDALLGLAASLMEIKESRAACQTLDKLAAEFPNARADVKATAVTLRRNSACR